MNSVWERMKETMKQDWEKLTGDNSVSKAVADTFTAKKSRTEKLEKKLHGQKQLIRTLEKEKDEVDVTLASRRRQLHLAREEGEDVLAGYAEKEIAAYEMRGERLAKMIKDAEEQQRELEDSFQELKHDLRDMELDQLEAERREEAAALRREMSAMKARPEEKPSEQVPEEKGDMNDMERQLILLEKRHAPKKDPADFLEK
ncbi:hypothetical protein [Alkalicoccus saliphilus]|uniref:PspA/IM30 family protein n=1 Tax=Alkalicoccus saliphilus TaxID=200989 RepID=A0A2T4U5K1_9BACI|nr:hypothetical protein [Alkalicoccus saliphilus]PTL38681.1 hypothetical protein C6Y45_10020 [Alkalicoccus saliphilus]